MLVKQMLPRARERLAVIEVEASVREAAYLMSKPHTDLVVMCSHGDMVGVVPEVDRAAWYSITEAVNKIPKGQLPIMQALAKKLSVWH